MVRLLLTLFGALYFSTLYFSTLAIAQVAGDGAQADVNADMVRVANALIYTIENADPFQESMLELSKPELLFEPLENDARGDWSFWPRPRTGLSLRVMTAEQRILTHELLEALLTIDGHRKVVQVMQLEEVLRAQDIGGWPRSVEDYNLTFFGRPSITEPWVWRFEGHHVSLNVSVGPNGIKTTPTFFGADPAERRTGPLAGVRALPGETDLARKLLLSLDESQRSKAVVSAQAPGRVISGNLGSNNLNKPGNEREAWRATLEPAGIAVADLDDSQQQLVRDFINEIIRTYRPEISSAYLDSIDLDELSFAWMGSLEKRQPHYFRLQGGDFLFELDNTQDDGNHIHSVWRSLGSDYGEDLLGAHYRAAHR
jgi:hypothetical protein